MQALAALFMMNNLHYMVKTVEGSEALTVLGEEWIEQHKDQVRCLFPSTGDDSRSCLECPQ